MWTGSWPTPQFGTCTWHEFVTYEAGCSSQGDAGAGEAGPKTSSAGNGRQITPPATRPAGQSLRYGSLIIAAFPFCPLSRPPMKALQLASPENFQWIDIPEPSQPAA